MYVSCVLYPDMLHSICQGAGACRRLPIFCQKET
jgi:hypothetical protein